MTLKVVAIYLFLLSTSILAAAHAQSPNREFTADYITKAMRGATFESLGSEITDAHIDSRTGDITLSGNNYRYMFNIADVDVEQNGVIRSVSTGIQMRCAVGACITFVVQHRSGTRRNNDPAIGVILSNQADVQRLEKALLHFQSFFAVKRKDPFD